VPDLARAIKEAEPLTPPPPQEPCASGARSACGQVFWTHGNGPDPLGGDIIGICVEFSGVRLNTGGGGGGRGRRIGPARLLAPGGEQMANQENEKTTKAKNKQFDDAVDQGILAATPDSIKR